MNEIIPAMVQAAHEAKEVGQRLRAAHIRKRSKAWKDWVTEAIQKGAGKAHRFTNGIAAHARVESTRSEHMEARRGNGRASGAKDLKKKS